MTDDTLRLAWAQPAQDWTQACPIGDGRLGAMVFGGATGRYQINDATAWAGTPDGPARELHRVVEGGANPARLAEVRSALDAGEHDRAEALLMTFEGRYTQSFLPFLDLFVEIGGARPAGATPARVLDLDRAVVEEILDVAGASVIRRSRVRDHALVIDLESAERIPEVVVRWSTPLRETTRAFAPGEMTMDLVIPVDGAPAHEPSVVPGIRYAEPGEGDYDGFAHAVMTVRGDGVVETDDAGEIVVRNARHVRIALSTSTRAESWWAGQDRWRTAPQDEIRDRARARVQSALADGGDASPVTRTPAARFAIGDRRDGCWDVESDILEGQDDGLRATVIAEYGRYLLESSSRRGGPAANLQGIWNEELRPAWSSNYTININTQMNYWAAGPLGLTDAAEPLISLVEHMSRTGADVARELYGARGWVAHHNTDLWGWSLPVGMGHGSPSWAIWMMGGVWLCHSILDLTDFSADQALLRERVWPLVRGAVEFCLDWLIIDENGQARLSPSTSPENMYRDATDTPRALGHTSTMDLELVRALFQRAGRTLDIVEPGSALRGELAAALDVLPPVGLTADGRLREWDGTDTEHEPFHRHMSPVIGLYPLDLISPDRTPREAVGARRLMDARGPGAMGWSWAWKIALRARLRQGDVAFSLLQEALSPYREDVHRPSPVDGSQWGGLLPNLFSTHPPFQIDGNLGFPAAIAEMLLQSHSGEIELLPALPGAWPRGTVQGIRARGGMAVDLTWSDGRPEHIVLHNLTGEAREVRVRWRDEAFDVLLPPDARDVVVRPTATTPGAVSGAATTVRKS